MQNSLTDKDLAELLEQQRLIEKKARAAMDGSRDISERSSAEVVVRHATATRRAIEQWMASRMARANGVATA